MVATKHSLDLPMRDDTTPGGGLVDDIKSDLSVLDHFTFYESPTEPDASIVHDGFLWYDTTASIYKFFHGPSSSWLELDSGGDVTAHIASNPATHATDSITGDQIAPLAISSAELAANAVTAGKIATGGISAAAQFGAGVVTDAALGNRTVDQALAGGGNTGTLTSLASWLAKFIKQIKGTTNWYDTPATDLAGAAAHAGASAPHGGHSTPATVAAAIGVHDALSGAHAIYKGSGNPEGVTTAPVGSWYRDAATGKLYRKASGAGNTGWVREGMSLLSVQRGTISLLGSGSVTATITAVGTLASISLLGTTSSGGADHSGSAARVELTNATTVTAIREGSSGNVDLGFQVEDWGSP